MTDPFPQWSASLRQQGKGPVRLKPATRRLFYSFFVTYPGNVTGATLEGQVKASPDAATALASFTIGTPEFADGKTSWLVSLSAGTGAGSTGSLPADTDGSGDELFPYDLVLTLSGGNAERLFGGYLPVSGQITEPA